MNMCAHVHVQVCVGVHVYTYNCPIVKPKPASCNLHQIQLTLCKLALSTNYLTYTNFWHVKFQILDLFLLCRLCETSFLL
jgi:hypothetical protein